MAKILSTPLTNEALKDLKVGDEVAITGIIYTARDAAHKRLLQTLDNGESLPIDIRGQIIYYVGPTPPKPGQIIGSAGPTTSMRMDPLTPPLLNAGLMGIIGKGGRGASVRESLKKHSAVYFGAIGGAGALLSGHIKKAEIIAYEDLGPEAIRKLTVESFPVIVVNDIFGNDLLEEGKSQWRKNIPPPA